MSRPTKGRTVKDRSERLARLIDRRLYAKTGTIADKLALTRPRRSVSWQWLHGFPKHGKSLRFFGLGNQDVRVAAAAITSSNFIVLNREKVGCFRRRYRCVPPNKAMQSGYIWEVFQVVLRYFAISSSKSRSLHHHRRCSVPPYGGN